MTRKLYVLVAEDNPENMEMLIGIIGVKYGVKPVPNGEIALKAAIREPLPSLIMLDVEMPVMDGFTTFARLKENPATAGIPVVFLSAADPEIQKKGLDMGAVHFLTKPYDAKEILDTIKKNIGE